ncbi:MAG: lysine--tRNA ligase [Candidatus Poseidoniaceae archaeon]|jgi:lysyl-tRNA synthetase class 1|nr:lysine--tRNA ligase [Candidatus Poseidoniaceae archaeon]
MHWADFAAQKLAERGSDHVIATGITPSGHIHVGNMREALTGDMLRRACSDAGLNAELIYIADNADPLRKVYSFLDESYSQYIGHPLANIPSPDEKGRPEGDLSYAQYHLEPFLAALDETGVKVRVVDNHQSYLEGKYSEYAKKVCDSKEIIREIVERVSGRELAEDWFPYNPMDSQGSMDGVKVTSYEWPYVNWVDSHGIEGRSDLRVGEGKLPWRIEWPAKWDWNKVTCEPFGKDHSAAGGSFDTGKEICRIFGNEAPMSLPYEWISLKGKGAMSSSTGVVLTARELLDIVPPSIMRYLVAKNKPKKAIEFDAGEGLIDLADEFERGQNNLGETDTENMNKRQRVAFETHLGAMRLSQINEKSDLVSSSGGVSFRHLSMLAQIKNADSAVWESLSRTHGIDSGSPNPVLIDRLKRMRNWILGEQFPASARISLREEIEPDWAKDSEPETGAFLNRLFESSGQIDFTETGIASWVREAIASSAIDNNNAYSTLYRLFLDADEGPRLASLLSAMDQIEVFSILEKAIEMLG